MPRPKVPDTDLFDAALAEQLRAEAPLADRLRPTVWQDFVGQKEVIGSGTPLRQLIEQDQVPSLIFWGPPGSGKTTLARLIAKLTRSDFIQLPAVASGLADLRQVVARASDRRKLHQTRTILFIDEIHRWNKAQQDALLPHVENGTVTLIGATTENPSFEVISALLSRCRVIIIKALAPEDIESILQRALKDKEYGFGKIKVEGATQAIKHLAIMASGDARVALNTLELAVKASLKDNQSVITDELIKQSLQRTHLVYDKGGEEHFNLISALHKSMRGSNPDAALYWLGRMLEAGEDPLYIARRLIRFASEDIGLADPQALVQATAGFQAAHNIGMPECNVILAQTVVYLANAPKSNSLYKAYQAVQQDVKATINEGVPLHLRNAPTDLMKEVGYGQGYKYNPDYDEPVEQDYLPPSLKGRKYLDNKNYQSKI
ncbi:MAG: Recombination protein MgsA [Parcubacteria group bacterium GW2011_GWD2_43_10]|nr:MAG: Recombination protein MgsA [Parcubacteria group bacterium GW2011_GWA2_42_80]KKS83555.1 MAG: Recombination protein MgsA [Parcubacteria group bacterium GW2011_GWD2_43_10]KKS93996.1 MAG: Recombination protein MgsA [Parcubacteria group bacterium GW2011_GWE2_43_12]KKT14253.1 MAG: Recombination protein MgsA [Parcubacteria group bacterium GW2011_GWA1_43_27]KKT15573.1 MAG: Recombination protein MgsA [Parcubacteria group bacterium GW2011_GWF2_43_38]KKT17612.1 MAG: Recombination protein MgsA [Pa